MEIEDFNAPLPYQVTAVLPSCGLARVTRDGDGLLLDYFGRDTSTAVRIGIHVSDAQKMLSELRQLVDLLERTVSAGNTNQLPS